MRTATSGTSDQAGSSGWSGIAEGGRGVAERGGRDPHHVVGDPGGLCRGDGKTHRREDIDVVALGNWPLNPVAVQRRER